jgi:hypothetical protein
MNRRLVSSSNLRSVGYNSDRQILEIEFHGGRVYRYFDVPLSVFEGLIDAASHGKYHNRKIKNRFRYQQIR